MLLIQYVIILYLVYYKHTYEIEVLRECIGDEWRQHVYLLERVCECVFMWKLYLVSWSITKSLPEIQLIRQLDPYRLSSPKSRQIGINPFAHSLTTEE